MPTPLTPAEVADQLSNLISDFHAGTITKEQFKNAYTTLWFDATQGGVSISLIGAQFVSLLGFMNTNQIQFGNWMTGSPTYDDPDPDQPQLGWYPLTNYLGERIWLPTPARMIADFAGIKVEGTLATTGDLLTGDRPGKPIGTVYAINGHWWIKNAGGYVDAGSFVGPQGIQGLTGNKGWAPILARVADGTRFVHQVADWVGGEGAKPATGQFIGSTGFVATAALAADIRGPQGIQGIQGIQGLTGPTGEAYTPDAEGLFSARSTYNAQAVGFSFLAWDQGMIYFRVGASGNWSTGYPFGKGDQGVAGPTGNKGWSAVLAAQNDGARRVFQVVDWAGGEGAKPVAGAYLGPTGFVSSIVDALDVRGPTGIQGATGDKGWSPVLTGVEDGNRLVLEVTDWAGGQGAKPAVGLYIGDAGLVEDIASAVDIKGIKGDPFVVNAVAPISQRPLYDGQDPGFVFLAQDESKLYVRVGSSGWSEGTPLIGGAYVRFRLTGVLQSSAQNINIPFAVGSVNELHIFFNGIKVRSEEYGIALAGTVLSWTTGNVTGNYEVVLPGGVRGQDGVTFAPDARGTLANRATYNAQAAGFVYLTTDTAAFYIRQGASGTWTGPFTLSQGPQGPQGDPGVLPWSYQTGSFNAAVKGRYIVAPAAAMAITLPAAPADADEIWIAGDFLTNNAQIARNGKTIEGVAQNINLADDDTFVVLTYRAALNTWKISGYWRYPEAKTKIVNAAAYTLDVKDFGYIIEFAQACVVTLPKSFPAKWNCSFVHNSAAGDVSWVVEAGATLRNIDSHNKVRGRYGEVSLRVRSNPDDATAEWWANGDTKS